MNEIATIRQPMKGNVTAIIPQSIEEVFRVSKGVVMSGLAPDALVKGKNPDEAAAAVAVAIMSGAELGLKPMVALRSFTVINGRPALFGDGLINVIRQSGRAEYLRTGCDERDGKLVGWCEAKRTDTSEDKRVEFSQTDAIKAGLWQTSGSSPWAKYPQRMLAWRAAGWCLRELFGDVLGGIRDEYEAEEIEVEQQHVIAPPPPEVEPVEDATDIEAEPLNVDKFIDDLDAALLAADSEDTLMEVWDSYDVEATLTHDDAAMQRAFDLRKKHADELAAAAQPASDFPGDK